MAKKNPYRFNLQFGHNDANNQEVVEILTSEWCKRVQFVENQRLRMENEYLKKLQALVQELIERENKKR